MLVKGKLFYSTNFTLRTIITPNMKRLVLSALALSSLLSIPAYNSFETATSSNHAQVGQDEEIKCERTVEKVSDTEFMVTLNISKGSLHGIAKLSEDLPQSFTAEEVELAQGYMVVKPSEIKITWMNLPDDQSFKVMYRLRADKVPTGNYSLKGTFAYLDGEAPKKQPTAVSELAVLNDGVAPLPKEPVVYKTLPNCEFRIQIAAVSKVLEYNFFDVTYGLKDAVDMTLENGIYKYVTGNFDDYYEASKFKAKLSEMGLEGAYIVAFKNGRRIPVTQALTIQ